MFLCATTCPLGNSLVLTYCTLRGVIQPLDTDLAPPTLEKSGSRRLGKGL